MKFNDLIVRIKSFRIDATVGGYCFLFVLSAYLYQGLLPAFNADDVIQIQDVSKDSYTFLGSGRWGYFFVFNKILDCNPAGIYSTLFGVLALFFSGVTAATVLGLRSGTARLAFIVLSCVSLYYGFLFSFDSTRLAYPIAVWLALYGVLNLVKRRYVAASVWLSLSLAFYQSAIQVAATVFILATLYGAVLGDERGRAGRFLAGASVIAASLLIYLIVTKILYGLLDLHLSARMSVSLSSGWRNRDALIDLFLENSVPFISGRYGYYMDRRIVLPVGVAFFAFIAICIWTIVSGGRSRKIIFISVLVVISLVAPFFLAFAASDVVFPPRSLIAYASLHAAWAAIGIDLLIFGETKQRYWRDVAGAGLVLLAVLIALGHFMQINKKAFDDYLVSQEDLLATNRIIYRIEEVIAMSADFPQEGPIPLAVVYKTPLPAGPRGMVGTSRAAPWAKEWIFRLIDRRFVVAPRTVQEHAELMAEERGEWPAKDAVFVSQGAVIVVINK